MTTREGGVSRPPWASFNLGAAVGDDLQAVRDNRARFAASIGARPVYLRQVHGARVVRVGGADIDLAEPPAADAAVTSEPGVACTVLVADCLPVLFAAPDGRAVAAAHAGWRGLAAGVLESALAALCEAAACAPGDVLAWLGPAIGPRRFEVGADVLDAFGHSADACPPQRFKPCLAADGTPRWLADLPGLARDRMVAAGLRRVSGAGACTALDGSRYFSFRRDGVTGRMAAAVWLQH